MNKLVKQILIETLTYLDQIDKLINRDSPIGRTSDFESEVDGSSPSPGAK